MNDVKKISVPRRPFTEDEIEATRVKLRASALRVFERDGYGAATMRSIAREAGFSAAAPYLYFASKEDLLTAIRAEGFRGLAEALEAAVTSANNPVAQLRGVLQSYIRYGVQRPELYRLMFSLRQGDSAAAPLVRVPRERSFGVARLLCRRLAAAGLGEGDANELAHLLWSNAHGLVSLHLANQLDLGADFESLVDPLVDHWARSVGAAPKRAVRATHRAARTKTRSERTRR